MLKKSLQAMALIVVGTLAGGANAVLAQPGCQSKAVVYNTETKKNECCGLGSTCVVCPEPE